MVVNTAPLEPAGWLLLATALLAVTEREPRLPRHCVLDTPRREEKGSWSVLEPRETSPGSPGVGRWNGSLEAVCRAELDPTAPVRRDISSRLSTFTLSPPAKNSSKSISLSMAELYSSAFNSCAVFTSDSEGGLGIRDRTAPDIDPSLVPEGVVVGGGS